MTEIRQSTAPLAGKVPAAAPPPPPPPPPPPERTAAAAKLVGDGAAVGVAAAATVAAGAKAGARAVVELDEVVITATPEAAPVPPPANAAEARSRADQLREEGTPGATTNTDTTIVTNQSDVNKPLTEEQQAGFRAQIEANGQLEQQALARLTPAQRAAYDRVAVNLANNPDARLSLQLLAIEGRLPGAATATNPANFDRHFWESDQPGDNLLTTLDNLTDPGRTPLAAGIDRQELLGAVVNEVATPSRIAQHNRGTCAATSAAIMLAVRNPAEYVRLATGLASPGGDVRLQSGDTIRREADTIDESNPSLRSISGRLMQPAFMEHGNGRLNYDNATDKHSDGHGGLRPSESVRLTEGLFGDGRTRSIEVERESSTFWNHFTDNESLSARDAAADIERAVRAGNGVTVGLRWGAPDADGRIHGGHRLVVTAINADSVTLTNPWGRVETMTRADFEARLKSSAIVE